MIDDLTLWDLRDEEDRKDNIHIEWQLRRPDGTVWMTLASKRQALAYGKYDIEGKTLHRVVSSSREVAPYSDASQILAYHRNVRALQEAKSEPKPTTPCQAYKVEIDDVDYIIAAPNMVSAITFINEGIVMVGDFYETEDVTIGALSETDAQALMVPDTDGTEPTESAFALAAKETEPCIIACSEY